MGRDLAERTGRELSREVGVAHLPVPNDDVAAAHARDAQTVWADAADEPFELGVREPCGCQMRQVDGANVARTRVRW